MLGPNVISLTSIPPPTPEPFKTNFLSIFKIKNI